MKQERVLITGCGGMLGRAMYSVFSKHYENVLATDIDLNIEWLSELDVRDYSQCKKVFDEFKPDIVLHLAALTDLEYCEQNEENSWLTNALGTENIGLLVAKNDCTMVYISTAGIVDGEIDYYTDFDAVNPLSHYAKSKYYGEVYVKTRINKFFVFRPGWMMGGGPNKDKKFINKIYKQITAGKKELFVVDDKLGTPTYTYDFANSIRQVMETELYGLYNQVCSGDCSRYDVAVEFVKQLGLEKEIKVTKVGSDHFKTEYFAPRPRSEMLLNTKLNARGINFMRDWKVCLEEYAKEYAEDLKGREI
jgi:dTDP-4-dehydrorhamnose reductase